MRARILGMLGALVAAGAVGCGSSEDDGQVSETPRDLWEQREVLAQVPFQHDGVPLLRVDGEHLYLGLNQLASDRGSVVAGRVLSVPKTGGELAELGSDDVFLDAIDGLELTDGTLFVVVPDTDADRVWTLDTSDGTAALLGDADDIVALAADDDAVYAACLGGAYSTGPSVQRIERSSGEQSELWPIGDVRALTVRDGALWLATNGAGVWRRPLAEDAVPERIGDDQLPPGAQVAFTPGGDRLFWVAGGTLGEVSLDDGTTTEFDYDGGGARKGRLLASDETLAWSELDENGMGLGLMVWSLESGEHALQDLTRTGVELGSDGRHLYGVTGYEIWRLPLSALEP